MAVALTVNTNTYITLANAETYLEGRLNTSNWDALTTDQKNRALVTAARNIDSLEYYGYRYVSTQVMKFPRNIAYIKDVETDGTTPQAVIDAQCEEAVALADQDYSMANSLASGVKRIKMGNFGSAEEEYFSDNMYKTGRSQIVSPIARSLLAKYIIGAVKIN